MKSLIHSTQLPPEARQFSVVSFAYRDRPRRLGLRFRRRRGNRFLALGLSFRYHRPSHRVFMTFFDPMLLLRMINGKEVPTKAVIAGLVKKLDSDPRYLEKLTAEIKPT
jgi:hypothetical protein